MAIFEFNQSLYLVVLASSLVSACLLSAWTFSGSVPRSSVVQVLPFSGPLSLNNCALEPVNKQRLSRHRYLSLPLFICVCVSVDDVEICALGAVDCGHDTKTRLMESVGEVLSTSKEQIPTATFVPRLYEEGEQLSDQ